MSQVYEPMWVGAMGDCRWGYRQCQSTCSLTSTMAYVTVFWAMACSCKWRCAANWNQHSLCGCWLTDGSSGRCWHFHSSYGCQLMAWTPIPRTASKQWVGAGLPQNVSVTLSSTFLLWQPPLWQRPSHPCSPEGPMPGVPLEHHWEQGHTAEQPQDFSMDKKLWDE